MGARGAKVLASLLALPLAGGGAAVVHSCGASRTGALPAFPDPPPVETPLPVFVGSARGLHFALAPAFPDRARALFDTLTLRERLSIPDAGFARLLVFRFEPGPTSLETDSLSLVGATDSGEGIPLRRLTEFPVPGEPREALVYHALAGPSGGAQVSPASGLDLWLVLPDRHRLEEFVGARVGSMDLPLARRAVLPADWRGFLARPSASFFTGEAASAGK